MSTRRRIATGVLLIMLGLPARADTLLVNGDFELLDGEQVVGWPGLTIANLTQSVVYSGGRAVAIEQSDFAGQGPTWQQGFLPTEPGRDYKLSAWLRCDLFAGEGWGYPELAVFDSQWQRQGIAPESIIRRCGDGRWHPFAIRFTASAGGSLVRFGVNGPRQHARLYFDALRLFAVGDNQPPLMDPVLGPTAGPAPLSVQFDARAVDLDGAVSEVRWDFGDGTISDQPDGTHVFGHRGDYPVRLSVYDDDGALSTAEFLVSVSSAEEPSLNVDPPAGVESGATAAATVTLNGTATPGAAGLARLVVDLLDLDRVFTQDAGPSWTFAELPLKPGRNRLLLTLTDVEGRASTRLLVIERLVSGPRLLDVDPDPPLIELYATWRLHFGLETVAEHMLFGFDPDPPPGVQAGRGVSAELEITQPDGSTLRQPAFFRAEVAEDEDAHLVETGVWRWELRYTPRQAGIHALRLRVQDASGSLVHELPALEVLPSRRPGFIRVAAADPRYFERDNGEAFDPRGPALDPRRYDNAGALNWRRPWLAGFGAWSSNWSRWISPAERHGNEGYMAPLDFRDRLPGSELSMFLRCELSCGGDEDDLDGWRLWQGFGIDGTQGRLRAGRRYRLVLRLRIEGLVAAGAGPHGLTLKAHDWPGPGQSWRDYLESLPESQLVLPPLSRDRPWHTVVHDFVAAADNAHVSLYLSNTARGRVAVDTISIREIDAQGVVIGGELMRNHRADLHRYVDPRGAADFDRLVAAAEAGGVALQVVVQDKNDWISRHLSPLGLFSFDGAGYYQPESSRQAWLQAQWWRYIAARWGPSTAIFALELNNEGAPDDPAHWAAAERLARAFNATAAHPHMASTSFWCCWRPEFWGNQIDYPNIAYADLHEYTDTAEPPLGAAKEALESDLAGLHLHLLAKVRDSHPGKPVVRAESGLDRNSALWQTLADTPNPGHWFHNLLWAQLDSSGVFDTGYWWSEHFDALDRHHLGFPDGGRSRVGVAQGYARFLARLDRHLGGYQALAVELDGPELRVIGQGNPARGTAHLWIQNRRATWRQRLENEAGVEPASGLIHVPMSAPGDYRVEWWDTRQGVAFRADIVATDEQGRLRLTIDGLADDVAVLLVPQESGETLFRDRFEFAGSSAQPARHPISILFK